MNSDNSNENGGISMQDAISLLSTPPTEDTVVDEAAQEQEIVPTPEPEAEEVIDEVEERKGELNEKFATRLKELETLVVPMLKGLMKNPDKEYIYWPNRTPILEKQIEKVYSITRES